MLLAAGLITGEALLGILLAVPIVLCKGRNPLACTPAGGPLAWPGIVLMVGVLGVLYRVPTRSGRRASPPGAAAS